MAWFNSVLYYSFYIAGFSRQMVELLNAQGAKYSHFDILTDNEVRQGIYASISPLFYVANRRWGASCSKYD